jgi:hypothetical protein
MKEITGFGTTEEDFDALPIAIQRKVRPSMCTVNGSANIPLYLRTNSTKNLDRPSQLSQLLAISRS